MSTSPGIKKGGSENWDLKQWMWALLCTLVIFSSIPFARSTQKFVYDTAGKDFFTYLVISVVVCILAASLYFFAFQSKVKKTSRYIWMFVSAGLYIYFTFRLREHPEEAVHLLEYGLLSYFVFRALSRRIRDQSIYITVVLIVLFVGTIDELIQWVMPGRYWGWKDVGINMLGGAIFQLAVWKGIKPEIISMPPKKLSFKLLAGMLTVNLIFLGLCLSNTPDMVYKYTSILKGLSWLKGQEPMTEYGHRYEDTHIGIFYSRLTLEELKDTDESSGEYLGSMVDINGKPVMSQEALDMNAVYFVDEFMTHTSRRNSNFSKSVREKDQTQKKNFINTAYRENLILDKLYKNTVKHSGYAWSQERINALARTASLWQGTYESRVGNIITLFSLRAVWICIGMLLITVWTTSLISIGRQND